MYCNSVARVTRLAKELGCNAYYYYAEGKANMLAQFIAGEQRVIVATSALGIRVDILDI